MTTKQIKIYKQHMRGKKFIKEMNVSDLNITFYEEYDAMGKLQNNKYVQFTVVGNNRSWTDFMAIDDFRKLNPDIKI